MCGAETNIEFGSRTSRAAARTAARCFIGVSGPLKKSSTGSARGSASHHRMGGYTGSVRLEGSLVVWHCVRYERCMLRDMRCV